MNNNQFTKKDKFGIRKFSVGVGSALLTSLLFLGVSHSADAAETDTEDTDVVIDQDNPGADDSLPAATTLANNGNTASDGVDPYAPTSEHNAEIDNKDPNTITNTYDGKNETEPTPGNQNMDPLYDTGNESNPTAGDQGTSPLEYDGNHEMNPTPGDQSQDPLADEPATEDNQGTDAEGNTVETDAEGNTIVTDAQGNTTVTDAEGNTTVTDVEGNTTYTDVEGNTTYTDAQGNTTVTDAQGNVVQQSTANAMTNEGAMGEEGAMDAQGTNGMTDNGMAAGKESQGTSEQGEDQGTQSKEDNEAGELPESGGSDMTVPLATSSAMLIAGLALLFRRRNTEK